MPRGFPVDPVTRARVLELAQAGKGRNEIARILGISTATVSSITKAAGADNVFDRSATRVAVEARRLDLAGLRARLAVKFATRAEELLDLMDKPTMVFSFGGKENTYEEHLLDSPPTADIRNLMTSAAIGAQRSLELTRFDSDAGQAKAGNLLDALAAGFTEAARLLDDDQADDTEGAVS